MKIGYLQFKPELLKPEVNIKKIEELTADLNFDLIVIPELANSGYLFTSFSELEKSSEEIPHGEYCSALKKLAGEKNAHIVSGICERAGDNYYNSSVLVYPDGDIKTYRKLHLFYEEKTWFKPGTIPLEVHQISGNYGFVKIGMMICFDWIFPETARTLALKGAQIICHPSNLVLQFCQKAMYARAVENRIYTVTANRIGKDINNGKELFFTGASVILDPKGNYLAHGSDDKEECFIVDIDPDKALDKNVTPLNNIFSDRRKEFYS